MNSIKRIIALMLAGLCVLGLAACSGETAGESEEDTSIQLEDGEDIAIEKAKVTVANVTGKDAVKLIARKSGTAEWSDNILSQDYLHTDMAVEITYNVSDNDVYDLRLIFEDESYQDFTNIDFSSGQPVYYLGN